MTPVMHLESTSEFSREVDGEVAYTFGAPEFEKSSQRITLTLLCVE